MLGQEEGRVRAVVWSELFPWLSLFRTFRLAIGFRVLVLSAAALVLTLLGWWLLAAIFQESSPQGSVARRAAAAVFRAVPEPEGLPAEPPARAFGATPAWVWVEMTAPLVRLFDPRLSLARVAFLVVAGLWGLAVWAFFGGAITRIVAVQLACEERLSWGAVVRHALSKWLAYFSAPLFPLVGVVLAALPVAVLGLMMRVGAGVFVASLLWGLFLVGGLLMALLLLGLVFGWPLMWATISSEGTDSFDALSRSYAYVFQRPLHYLFYAIVATVLGGLGWLLVWYFAAAVIGLTYWAASWGAGTATVEAIRTGTGDLGRLGAAGAAVIHFWTGIVKLLAVSYLLSFFWTSATAIYFLLRRDVDATEMDEVYLEDEEQAYGLPPLKPDEAGVPVMQAPAAPNE